MLKRRFAEKWYVYALIDQRNQRPFYVGITSNWQLREESHLGNPCVVALCDVKPTMECIRIVDSEELARRIERHLIRKLPGLVNVVHATKDVGNQRLSPTTVRLAPIAETYQVVAENIP